MSYARKSVASRTKYEGGIEQVQRVDFGATLHQKCVEASQLNILSCYGSLPRVSMSQTGSRDSRNGYARAQGRISRR